MMEIAAGAAATAVTVPPLVFIGVFLVLKKLSGRSGISLRLSADMTALLFMISVYYMIDLLWGMATGWFIFIGFLSVASLLTILQWIVLEEVRMAKVLKQTWRFHFLVYAVLYTVLAVIGLFII
ncbi:DUF3397 family protein [Alkalicoccus luteus]|uniref:DUF3397 domain-containing protein n=1 Tax=Alkalicoccus luteus TaxID=1237094 RepID=A0A969PLL5_9BACI|nr:DUF3397 family protein [Alkalicoccus luteus]NJP36455.1 DUF3397 domain-containing protein [Alkalicoccus luteus]